MNGIYVRIASQMLQKTAHFLAPTLAPKLCISNKLFLFHKIEHKRTDAVASRIQKLSPNLKRNVAHILVSLRSCFGVLTRVPMGETISPKLFD